MYGVSDDHVSIKNSLVQHLHGMVPLVLLVGGDGGSVGAVVDDASLEPAEKKQ